MQLTEKEEKETSWTMCSSPCCFPSRYLGGWSTAAGWESLVHEARRPYQSLILTHKFPTFTWLFLRQHFRVYPLFNIESNTSSSLPCLFFLKSHRPQSWYSIYGMTPSLFCDSNKIAAFQFHHSFCYLLLVSHAVCAGIVALQLGFQMHYLLGGALPKKCGKNLRFSQSASWSDSVLWLFSVPLQYIPFSIKSSLKPWWWVLLAC